MKEIALEKFNIGIVLFSFSIAFLFPFELFLFSYAFLGPIHYLTEINWLHQKKFFAETNFKWTSIFVVFTVFITASVVLNQIPSYTYYIKDFFYLDYAILSISALLFSIGMLSLKKKTHLIFALISCIFIVILFRKLIPTGFYLIGVFLPTIIHVYIFTIAFMLYGSLKSKSSFGFISLFMVILVPIVIILFPIDKVNILTSSTFIDTYKDTNFTKVNQSISVLFRIRDFSLTSAVGVKIQIFIAFAYTYHYLNWFLKTNIIGWKKSITKNKLLAILIIWAGSICLYLYDYQIGLIALFFLSILHVFLEFPLNIITIKESFRLFKNK
ncbi:hypothetical protein [Frigoriflavimonas asaccharolytica]|uniref:Uncharacterized protein n=1 Tax=Frigoriflavimonas asaccharolytica TaxID=2735899 RepID=A0A8J8K4F1_9FLAO|nr:hypothetical protein [Frigoriflavimonas asaccharolytica]NRS91650.1 hypothetical protein [Frigoriflavimonas asaccharolytica]